MGSGSKRTLGEGRIWRHVRPLQVQPWVVVSEVPWRTGHTVRHDTEAGYRGVPYCRLPLPCYGWAFGTFNRLFDVGLGWVGWVGLGHICPRQSGVRLGWVHKLMGWVGLGYRKWTHGRVWAVVTWTTLCPKKVYPVMFDNNFGKCGPIFITSFVRKLSVHTHKDYHLTCNTLLHYLVKVKNPKMLLIFTASSTNCWHVPDDTLRTWFNIWQ